LSNKRGISPLIATVLLIGLVIAIISTIMLWSRNIIKEEIEKRAPVTQGKLTCQTEVEINVEDVCVADGKIEVAIRNMKEKSIPKIKGIVISKKGKTFVEDWAETTISSFERETIKFGYRSDITPQFIEIIPVIYQEGDGGNVEVGCDNQKVRSRDLTDPDMRC